MDKLSFLGEFLAQKKEDGLYRSLKTIEGPQASSTLVNGRKMLLFSSNNYLGLTEHPRLKAAVVEAVSKYGTGSGGSRLINGNMYLHRELERRIALFKGTEDAIVFGSGYMANLGTISALVDMEDLIISDELNHASIIDGCRLSRATVKIYRHRDIDDLHRILAGSSNYRRRLIVTDGVFSMDGDLAPLPEIIELAKRYEALLMVDDAHGTGVMGKGGVGTAEHLGVMGKIDVQMGTLSKALGGEGGFIAGNALLIDYLRNKARSFIYSTAPSPLTAAVGIAALETLADEPELVLNLHRNAAYLRKGLQALGYRVMPGESAIVPVIIEGSKETLALAAALEEVGVFVPAIRPPTVPEGTCRLRVTPMATHTLEDLDFALAAFEKAREKLRLKRVK